VQKIYFLPDVDPVSRSRKPAQTISAECCLPGPNDCGHDPDGDWRPGEEQNAALARAVVGGLLFATLTTLLIVPYLFALLRKGNDGKQAHGVFEEVPE
jgi:hypothetical protein